MTIALENAVGRALESLIVITAGKTAEGKRVYRRKDSHTMVPEKDLRVIMAAPLVIPCGLVDGRDGKLYSEMLASREGEDVPKGANAVVLWKYLLDEDRIARNYSASYCSFNE